METSKEPTEIIEMHSENVQNTDGGDKTVPDHTINIKSVDDGQPNSLIVQKYQFLRDTCRLIIHSRPYIFVTCLVVLFNGAILATYTRKQPQTEWLRLVVQLDNYLSIAFIVDVLLKCIALGVRGVLSDPWYRMDVLVTALSCISWANALADLSPLRVLLLVKFLPRMSYFHHVGTILKALHRSLPLMRDIGILSLVFFLSWGIAGTKLYGGKLHQRCVFTNNGTILDETKMCSMNVALGYQCPEGTSCLPVAPNPSEGIVSFDNLLSSWLTMFQILTGEGWSSIMNQIKGSTGPASMVYFLAVIFIGNYILVQLLVSVVVNSLCSVIEESAENLPAPNSPENNDPSSPVLSVDSPNGSDSRSVSSGRSAIGNIDFRFTESEYQKLPVLRQYAYRLICSKWFEFGVMSIIIANTAALAAHHHNMSPTFSFNLDIVNEVCTILFTIELVAKLVALFPRNYCKSTVNILDGLITIVSLADLLSQTRQVSTLSIFRVFRAFLRTFRLLRLLRLSKPLLRLIKIIVDAWPLLRSLGAIWIIGVFVFACLGIQFFSDRLNFDPTASDLGRPRAHFDTFGYASLSTFQLYSVENWNDVAASVAKASGLWATLFPIIVIVIGGFVLSQMLLAILITTFQDEMNTIVRLAKEKNKAKFKFVKRLAAKADVRQYFGTDAKKAESPISPTHDSKKNDLTLRSPAQISLSLDTEKLHRKLQAVDPTSNSPISPNMGFRISLIVEQKIVSDRRQLAGEEEANKVSTTDDHNRAPSIIVEHSMTDEVGQVDAVDSQNHPSLSPSTSLFSPQQENLNSSLIGRPPPNTPHRSLNRNSNLASNPMSSSLISLQTNFKSFYKILQQFVRGTIFAWFSFLLILGSCIALAFDGPTPENRPKELATIDLFFAIAFTIEVLLNAFTSRLIKGDDPFLKSAWNWLDIFIVIISWITVNSDLLGLKIYRVLRVVRVVKLIKLSKPLRIVTTAIMKTIPMLRTIIIPFLMFLFLASIFGLHVFGGLGWQCNDDSVNGKEDCVGTFIDPATGASTERLWYPYRFYYDNIFHSLLSVLVISFQEGWPNDMYRYMDVTAVDRQPRRDSTPLASAFFVIVEFIGSWFFLAVVTGVIFDNLKHYQEKLKGLQLLTEEQKDRLTNLRFLFVVRPPIPPQIPKNQFHEKLQKVVLNTKFEYGCIAIVCLNIALMAIDHYGAPQALRIFFDISQIIFTAAYVVEIIMLFVGLGYRAFFADKWNIVKILIIISAIIDHVFQFISSANIFVIIRILRIFRIFRSAKGLNALVLGLIINFAQLLNVLFLMVVICFVYAVLGVQYYGKIAYVDGLSSEVNFTTFWNAFYAVYVASTGENWPVIMSNCMVDPPFCDLQAGNCGTKWAPVYFISLQLLMNWILLNSFIAIVVDSFHHMLSNDDIIQTIEQSVEKFNQLWVEYDIRGTQVITIWDFLELYERIEPPLIHLGGRQMHIRVAMSGVPVYNGGNLQYVDVIRSLFIATFAKDLPPSFIRKLRKKGAESNQQRKFIKFLRKGDETERIVEEKPFEVAHATLVIQRLAKAWLEKRKKIREINAGKRNFDKELLKKPNLEEIGVTGPVGVSLKRRESQIGKNEPGLTRRGTRTSLIRPLSMAKNVEEGVSKNEATPGKRKSMLAEQEKSIPIIPDAILEDAVTEKNEQPELQPKAKPDQEMDLPVSSPPLLIQAETVEEELSNSRSEIEVKEPLSSSPLPIQAETVEEEITKSRSEVEVKEPLSSPFLPIQTETIEPEVTKKRTEGEETVKEKELERRLSVGIENPVETVDQLLQNENEKTSNSGHV